MERFNMSMRKYLKEVGVTSQQAIERLVREQNLAGKGKLQVRMVLTAKGADLNHVVDGEIDLSDATRIDASRVHSRCSKTIRYSQFARTMSL